MSQKSFSEPPPDIWKHPNKPWLRQKTISILSSKKPDYKSNLKSVLCFIWTILRPIAFGCATGACVMYFRDFTLETSLLKCQVPK